MQSASQIRVNDANIELIRAQAGKVAAEEAEVIARTPTHAVSIDKMRQDILQSKQAIEKMIAETTHTNYSAINVQQQTQNLIALLPQIDATVKNLRAMTKLTGTQEAEVAQRIQANLPALEAALKQLHAFKMKLEQPQQMNAAGVHDTPILGGLSALLRAFNPLVGILK